MPRVSRTGLSPLAVQALSYAGRGWPVLPLVPGQKLPLSGNNPRTPEFPTDGLLSATTDLGHVIEWWSLVPQANIGLRTGVAFDVLDFDSDDAVLNLRLWAGDPTLRAEGPISATGKGQHWLFLPTGRRNSTGLLDKVDYRGANGYIVAPPSVHPSGAVYSWGDTASRTLPAAPGWLLRLLDEKQPPKAQYTAPVRRQRTNGVWEDVIEKALLPESEDILAAALDMGYRVSRSNKMKCPFHNGDSNWSLQLYPHDNSFFCFGCQAVGFSSHLRSGKPIGR